VSLDSSIDPDIAAAFNGQTPDAAPSNVDPDIAAAFADQGSGKAAKESSPFDKYVGFQESQLAGFTGGVGSLAGGLSYLGRRLEGGTEEEAQKEKAAIQNAMTYAPRTEEGKKQTAALADASQYTGAKEGAYLGEHAADAATSAGFGPTASGVIGAGTNVLANVPQFLLGAKSSERGPTLSSEVPAPAEPVAAPQGEPVGTQLPADISQSVQEAKQQAAEIGQPLNEAALTRHLQSQRLPAPIDLTLGQATQEHAQLADEFNRRNTPEGAPIADRMNSQNGKLIQNVNAIRDQAAPDAALRSTDEHAQTLMDAYQADKDKATADISAKYQKLTDANGGDFPIDGQKLVANIDAALKQKLKTGHLSPGMASALSEFRDGSRPMNFEDFETLRTDAATEMRGPDGNKAAAAGIIRQQAENLPLTGEAADLKPLADDARAAARAQFAKEAADPAYKAVVDGNAKSNTFFNRYVLNAPREHVQLLQDNIGDNPEVKQALAGGTVNFLKQRAGITGENNGNLSQAGYNRALQSVRPKLDLLADQSTVDHLNTLGDVARYTQFQPRGKSFNNSGTEVVRQGEVRQAVGGLAAGTAEHATNAAAMSHGIPIAVGSIVRKISGARSEARAAAAESAARQAETARALAPGAGIGGRRSLSELMQANGTANK